jgi:hypothetical protein
LRLARIFEVSLEWLCDDTAEMPPPPKREEGAKGQMLTEDERTILKMASVLGYDVAMLRLMNPPQVEQRPTDSSTHWIAGPPR